MAELAENCPGPVAYLRPKSNRTPAWVSGKCDGVAIRVSDHPVIQGLYCELGGPMIFASQNPPGKPAALNGLRLKQYFGDRLDKIVPLKLGGLSGPAGIRARRKDLTIRQSRTAGLGKS